MTSDGGLLKCAITVNPSESQLGDGEKLTLTDVMTNLSPMMDSSLKVIDKGTKETLQRGTDWSVAYDAESHQMTFTLPNSRRWKFNTVQGRRERERSISRTRQHCLENPARRENKTLMRATRAAARTKAPSVSRSARSRPAQRLGLKARNSKSPISIRRIKESRNSRSAVIRRMGTAWR